MQKFTSLDYLKIDIASSFGLDKKKWNVRLAWFHDNEHKLLELVNQAKEPALFYAGVRAYEAALRNEPTGYMISLDATSSGLQLLAALTCDRSASQLCNVVDTGEREDAYEGVYNEMLFRIKDTATISRDDCKDAIMTSLYGSKAVPKQVFGEGALLDTFYQTMNDVAPAVWELNQAFLALWNPDAFSHDWILPDNFHVHIKVMNQIKETVHFLNQPFDVYYNVNMPMEEGRSLGANVTHSVDGFIVREMTRRCDYDPKKVSELNTLIDNLVSDKSTSTNDDNIVLILWDHYKQSGFLSARIIQHLNRDNIGHVDKLVIRELLDSLPDKPFRVISIHD